jgi:hypothetical protein
MASKVKFQLNRAGVYELLNNTETRSMIDGLGARVLNSVPQEKGYSLETGNTTQRCFARVQADTYEAGFYNKKTNCLVKALGSAKL